MKSLADNYRPSALVLLVPALLLARTADAQLAPPSVEMSVSAKSWAATFW